MGVEIHGVEIVITSSSRPELFKQFWKSFEEMVFVPMRDEIRITIHEDFLISKKSNEIKKFVLSRPVFVENKDHFFISTNPAEGLGRAFEYLLNYHIRSKFVLYLQDDCIIEKPIILDKIVKFMNEYPWIQQIIFPKNKINTIRKTGGHRQFKFSNEILDLTQNDGWSFMPDVFRTDFMREYWSTKCANTKRPETIFGKSLPREYKDRQSYFLGKPNDERHINHAGEFKSTKEII